MQKHNNYDMCRKTRLSILVALVLLGSFLATDVEAAAVSGIEEVVREHSIEYVEPLHEEHLDLSRVRLVFTPEPEMLTQVGVHAEDGVNVQQLLRKSAAKRESEPSLRQKAKEAAKAASAAAAKQAVAEYKTPEEVKAAAKAAAEGAAWKIFHGEAIKRAQLIQKTAIATALANGVSQETAEAKGKEAYQQELNANLRQAKSKTQRQKEKQVIRKTNLKLKKAKIAKQKFESAKGKAVALLESLLSSTDRAIRNETITKQGEAKVAEVMVKSKLSLAKRKANQAKLKAAREQKKAQLTQLGACDSKVKQAQVKAQQYTQTELAKEREKHQSEMAQMKATYEEKLVQVKEGAEKSKAVLTAQIAK